MNGIPYFDRMLKNKLNEDLLECGTDEAGRGCLAGPVTAAAVILPDDFDPSGLNDSKQLSHQKRTALRQRIEAEAVCYSVVHLDHQAIDRMNILQASIAAMQTAIAELDPPPAFIAVDGNRFNPVKGIPHQCVVKGDSRYLHIAAASILAKTHRDELMTKLHTEYPQYQWDKNKGYPTSTHRNALRNHGPSPYHRLSFRLLPEQLSLDL